MRVLGDVGTMAALVWLVQKNGPAHKVVVLVQEPEPVDGVILAEVLDRLGADPAGIGVWITPEDMGGPDLARLLMAQEGGATRAPSHDERRFTERRFLDLTELVDRLEADLEASRRRCACLRRDLMRAQGRPSA